MTILPLRRASQKSHSLPPVFIICTLVVFLGVSFSEEPHRLSLLFISSNHSPLLQLNPIQISLSKPDFSHSSMAARNQQDLQSGFEDCLPAMAYNLGGEGLIGELCNGFNLLMDGEKGVIDFESLKRNAAVLGLGDFSDEDLRVMLAEGDFDGDGALNEMEFCVLMFRLSPELMDASRWWFEETLRREFGDFC